MRINNNLMAMNTHRQLGINANNGSKSIEKLSSGYRINRAGDDAAGLAISEKMRGQIRGLNQASRNAQDGISLVQTAEGALNESQAILQRMRELAVQASNDTLVGADRNEIQKEISQLNGEINRIADTTEFNTQKLLNGSLGAAGQSANAGVITIESATSLKIGTYDVTVSTAATKATKTSTANATDAQVVTAVAAGPLVINGITIDTSAVSTVANLTTTVNSYKDQTGVQITAGANGAAALVLTQENYGSTGQIDLSGSNAAWTNADAFGAAAVVTGLDAVATFTNPDSVSQTVTGTGQALTYGSAAFTATGAGTTTFAVTSSGASIHIGANADQTMLVDVNEMSTTTLGNATNKIKDITVLTASGAETAITTIDDAIKQVSAERSKLGAFQNRMEHTIKNLDTSSENLQASESRIRDVDMAKEMMEFTKNNILQQAAQAMLAQANQAPQGVLQLLR